MTNTEKKFVPSRSDRLNLTSRQEEILYNALQIVAEHGTKALTMKQVANKLNITEAAIYRHFKSKRHMLICLYSYVKELLVTALQPVLLEECSAHRRLTLFIHRTIDYLIEHKGVNLILLAESIYHKDKNLKKSMDNIFSGFSKLASTIIQEGINSGEFRSSLRPDIAATCLAGMIQGALTRHMLQDVMEKNFDMEIAKNGITDCFINGISASNNLSQPG